VTILSLGEIDPSKEEFSSAKYIWPIGFKSYRLYASIADPDKRCKYVSEILLGSDDKTPVFRVTPEEDESKYVEGVSATNAWSSIIAKVNEKKNQMVLVRDYLPMCQDQNILDLLSPRLRN